MSSKWGDLRPRSWRTRMRVRRIRAWWWLRAKLGFCAHPATIGPAGGSEGYCLACRSDVPWDDE